MAGISRGFGRGLGFRMWALFRAAGRRRLPLCPSLRPPPVSKCSSERHLECASFSFRRSATAAAMEEPLAPPTNSLAIADEVRSLFADVDQERIRAGVEGVFVDGKFRYLMRNVIATPSNLMAAYNSIKKRSGSLLPEEARQMAADGINPEIIQRMARDLAIGTFDVKANCVELPVSSKKSSSRTLVIPNLKLKIAMEATRMALEEVYEPRFSSFSFAFRPRRGRHMALRLIKYRWKFLTWWIRVKLRAKFLGENMDTLVAILEETFDDSRLTAFLQQLFRARVLQMDIGELHWGDFSKEPILSPMLLNIYLDKLDSKIMEVAEGVASMNPEDPNEKMAAQAENQVLEVDIGIVEEEKPPTKASLADEENKAKLKLYACRYGDDLLMAVAGPKEIAITVQHEVCLYLNEKLMVEVDKGRGALQEAAVSTCDFLGFELQFVPPSRMPGFKSQKTIQAMRKVQNRVEMVKRQQKAHWDATLRKLGGEMLIEIYRRARKNAPSEKRGDQTVKRMFQSVAGDVVREFLQTNKEDDKLILREKFKKGHVLLSPWVRQQIPKELTDAYDRFQEQLDKFLGGLEYSVTSPDINVKLRKKASQENEMEAPALKLMEQREDELRLIITMPEGELVDKLRLRDLVDKGGRGLHFSMLVNQEDIAIIQWYAGLAKRWLDYYRCSDNFAYVKRTVDYQLKYSMLYTLAAKHKSTARKIIQQFSPDLKVVDLDGNMTSFYPTPSDLRNMGKKFLCPPQFLHDTKCGDGVLYLVLTRMSRDHLRGKCCAVIGCYSGILDMYLLRVHKLKKRIYTEEDDWMEVIRVGTLHSVYDWKALPMCFEHYLELLSGRISISNVRAEAWVVPRGRFG